MKAKTRQQIAIILMFTMGLAVLLYPFVSNWFNNRKFITETNLYEEDASFMDENAMKEEWQKAIDYNNSLKGQPVKDPFVPGSGRALPENYLQVLNTSQAMCVVEIPAIDVKLPVHHGTDQEVLKNGLGHLEGTSLPIGSQGGHTFITGHTGLPTAELFTGLDKLEIGNQFFIKVLDKELVYQVDQIKVITPEEFSQLPPDSGGDYVTLVTCTPYGINSHRLLVRGTRVYNMSKSIRLTPKQSFFFLILFIVFCLAAIVTGFLLFKTVKKRKEYIKSLQEAMKKPQRRVKNE